MEKLHFFILHGGQPQDTPFKSKHYSDNAAHRRLMDGQVWSFHDFPRRDKSYELAMVVFAEDGSSKGKGGMDFQFFVAYLNSPRTAEI
jgi:hypothetical protein